LKGGWECLLQQALQANGHLQNVPHLWWQRIAAAGFGVIRERQRASRRASKPSISMVATCTKKTSASAACPLMVGGRIALSTRSSATCECVSKIPRARLVIAVQVLRSSRSVGDGTAMPSPRMRKTISQMSAVHPRSAIVLEQRAMGHSTRNQGFSSAAHWTAPLFGQPAP
jgi:hypothetical protein